MRQEIRTIVACLFLVGLSLLCAIADAANLFGELHWRLIGPFRGGRVLAVAGIPDQPKHFYFGSVGGGVWETQDAGRTWQPIFDEMPAASIGAIAIAPSDPKVIYVGSGEADMRSDIGYGNGLYKSTDSGQTWLPIGLTDSQQIGRILVDSRNPDVVIVAALGHAYGPNEERGVFRSKDGGRTWNKILYKDADTGAIDLAFGANEQTIYAALWQTRRPPWNVYPPSNGPGSGLYKSVDGGDHWTQIENHGFPSEGLGRIGIAVAPADPNIVYAILDAKSGGLYRSEDSGFSWKLVSEDERIWSRGWYFGGVTVDPKDPDVVYVCDTALYKSTDGGKTFLPFRGSPGGDDYHTLWIASNDSARMIAGVDQGAVITINGGQTWSSWYNQPTGQFYHVSTDNRFPYWVYGAQQDSGAASVPSRTTLRDGINMMQFVEVTAGGENGYIAPDPLDPNIIYGGSVSKLNLLTEQTQDIDPTFAYPEIYRSEWTLPLTFSPRDPHLLYFANQYLFRTSDAGKHWTLLSPDLTRKELTVPPNLDPVTAKDSATAGPRRGVIYAIAPSPQRDRRIWLGTDDGLVWLTDDEGVHWRDITPRDLTPWSKVGIIEASHFDPDTAYAAIDRHRINDYKPYIYRTQDSGNSWKLIAEGIPDGHFVNVVREDPMKKGLLYAGTELGVSVSFDDGDHWQPLQLNLPPASVRDLNVHGDDLVIATHGRAFWILDNIAPFREYDPNIHQPQARLFQPSTAYRIHPAGFTGTPLPKDEPMALNPPFGAMIDYYLAEDAAAPLTLEIIDEQGKTVRTYSSNDKAANIDAGKIVITPNWIAPAQPPSASAGMHRFLWDLHAAFPDALREEESTSGQEPLGIWALPGLYTVKLTVNQKTYTKRLQVTNDPRVKVLQIDLIKQHEFAQQIQSERLRLMKAVTEVKNLLKQAETTREKASGKLAAQIASFEDAVSDLTELHAVPIPWSLPGSSPLKVTSLAYLKHSLEELQYVVDDADAPPSPDALRGFEKQRAVLQQALKDWDQFKTRALPDLNAVLKQAGLAPLHP